MTIDKAAFFSGFDLIVYDELPLSIVADSTWYKDFNDFYDLIVRAADSDLNAYENLPVAIHLVADIHLSRCKVLQRLLNQTQDLA